MDLGPSISLKNWLIVIVGLFCLGWRSPWSWLLLVWALAQSHWTSGTFLSRLPGLATAERIEVHFWWNVGEMLLLLLASHVYIRSLLREYASK
ncbi:MAG: hypothetical protein H6651_09605 [Ardenticatenales bacterium]|nr:hypothetical protein [Ardenticatenales bacterium]